MPKINRTPPSTPSIEVQRAMSNPNIATPPNECEFINTQQRSKRSRLELSPTSELADFKEDIRLMLAEWKASQEKTLEDFMSKITHELIELKAQKSEMQNLKSEIEDSANLMNAQYEEIRANMKKLENERAEQRKYIYQLEKQIKDVQEINRSAVIEFRNISPKEKETVNDITNIVVRACKSLEVEIKPEEIRDIYRVRTSQGMSKQIITEFKSVTVKNALLRAVREFNKGKTPNDKLNSRHIGITGECIPIYIIDRLPASSRKLYYDARTFAKNNGFQYCWTSNGKIFIRKKEGEKPIPIIAESTFQTILHENK